MDSKRNEIPKRIPQSGASTIANLGSLSFGIAVIVLLAPWAASAELSISILNFVGYLSFAFGLYLLLFTLRSRIGRPRSVLIYGNHKAIGYLSILFAALHTAGYLVLEPLTWQYLAVSAPLYIIAGLVAIVLSLLQLSITSHAALKSGEKSAVLFRRWHVATSAVLIALCSIHAGGAALHFNHWQERVLTTAFVLLSLGSVLRPRQGRSKNVQGAVR